MAKKAVSKTEQKVQDNVVEETQQTKKVVAKKTVVKKDEPKKEIVKEEEELLEEEGDDSVEDSTGVKKKRVAPTRESVIASFDDIITSIEREIGVLRDSQNKTKGVKFLRTLGKKLKGLK